MVLTFEKGPKGNLGAFFLSALMSGLCPAKSRDRLGYDGERLANGARRPSADAKSKWKGEK